MEGVGVVGLASRGWWLEGRLGARAGKAASPPSHFAQMASFGAQATVPNRGAEV